jgi:signal peptidase II
MRIGLVALLAFGFDRWSKYLVETRMSPMQVHPVIPGFFDIVRTHNRGVAFGFFDGAASQTRAIIMIAFSLSALVLLAWLLWRNRTADLVSDLAIGLIIGGAAGNIFDRIRAGAVTDFLDFYSGSYHWYTFNIADSAITVGACLLLFGMLRRSSPAKAHA